MSEGPVLLSERDGAVAVLTLHRPAAKNTLDEALLTALNTELGTICSDDSVRAVVLTGADGVFCAGADITGFDRMRADALLGERAALGGRLWADLGTFEKPVIAAVEGLALGGGTQRLVHAVGKSKAMAMLLTGDLRSAAQACDAA